MDTYKIIDSAGATVAEADDKHEIDAAWDTLLKNDEELAKAYGESYAKQLVERHRRPFIGRLELVQVWKTSDWAGLVGKNYEDCRRAVLAPYFLAPTSIDGNTVVWTMDLNPYRVGVVVEGGLITSVKGIG
jgi:hypothetical protein